MDDNKTIEQILSGNKNLYGNLMEKYYKELFHFVYNITGSVENTEDVLQEVFFKVYKRLEMYSPTKSQFRTWLYRITNNHVLNYVKSKSYTQSLMTGTIDVELFSEENIEDGLLRDEQITEIVSIMNRVLSKKHLKIMHLHYFSGLTVNEISEAEGIPVKTIYKAIKTSINKIKEVETYE